MRSFPMPVTAPTSPTTASDLRDFIGIITTFSSLYDDDGRTWLVWVYVPAWVASPAWMVVLILPLSCRCGWHLHVLGEGLCVCVRACVCARARVGVSVCECVCAHTFGPF